MPSVGTKIAQRLTKSFVTNSDAYLLHSDVSSWVDYGSPTQVGNLYIYDSPSSFIDGMEGLWNEGANFYPEGNALPSNITLKDLGKDIYFGTRDEPNLVHMRLVGYPGSVANLGQGGIVGYTYVEINSSELAVYGITVGVSRV